MTFPLSSHEEFSFGFSTVSVATPRVSADCLKSSLSERYGLTCYLVYNHD